MNNIIGLGGSIHDYATCLLQDKEMIAIEDERLTRIRYSVGSKNPCLPSMDYCLKAAGLNAQDINTFAMNDDITGLFQVNGYKNVSVYNHHLTHAYSTFFTSPFHEAAILIIDGAGSKKHPNKDSEERETTTYAYGVGNNIKILNRVYGSLEGENPLTRSQTVMSNSLGEFYRVIAETLEMGWLVGPGKVMGLAPYGLFYKDDRFVSNMLKCIELLPDGQFIININGTEGLIDTLYTIRQTYHKQEGAFRIDAAIAYSGQIVLEMLLSHLLEYLSTQVSTDNLCIAGGVGLNSMVNGKIPEISKFKNVHVFYSPGDSGTAIGAAVGAYLSNHNIDELVRFEGNPYLGQDYKNYEIEKCLKIHNLTYSIPKTLHHEVAHLLSQGKIVAWYQDKSEFGPRALGNRSILADPRDTVMRDRINHTIKQREWFRPLAPAVIGHKAKDYFNSLTYSPWMQFVWPVKEEFYVKLPSITHIDGSSRVQTVTKEGNSSFYLLLEKFEEITGFPILLNTSFNINGEPIVETPDEAIRAFLNSQIDVLALGEYLITRK